MNSWRGEKLVKTQIFSTSFDLVAVHEGYFQFDYVYKLIILYKFNLYQFYYLYIFDIK